MISKDTIRPGMTAIAAVIALSSTPLFAQEAVPQTTPNAVPTQVTPPTVVPTAPNASVPTTVTPPAATTVAPQPATPVIQLAPPAPVTPAPVEAAPPVAATAPERPARAASPRAETPRPAASQRSAAPAAPVEAQPVAPPAAIEAAPVSAPAPLAVEAAPVEEAAPPATAAMDNGTLPLVGAGALAVLALGAAGFALSRRRRRDDVFVDETVEAEPMMADPIVPPAPAFARETAPVPQSAAAATTLPNGFDVSRYGRHVQAAYRGPTPDNPFVSLKKRLTRAHFYDMQEASAAETATAPQAAAPAPRPTQDRFEVRSPVRSNAQTGGFRPAFQR